MAHAGLQSLQLEKYAQVRLRYHRSAVNWLASMT
jgi:hypothetical protein